MTRLSWLINIAVLYGISLIFLAGAVASVFFLHYFPQLYGYWMMAVFAIPISAIYARVWNWFAKAEEKWEALAPAFWIEAKVATPVAGMATALTLRLVLNSPYLAAYFGWIVLVLGGITSVFLADRAFSKFRLTPPVMDVGLQQV